MLCTRPHLNTLALALLAAAPAAAQETGDPARRPAVSASAERFTNDGESGLRVGAVWQASASFAIGATGRWWGGYRVIEPEARWYPLRVRREPFIAVSGIVQQHGDVSGRGFSLWAGAQADIPELPIGISAAVGWRSLYRSGVADSHWPGLRTGVTLTLY